jgi:diketogulonate reductase-like aldo/keto reductase
MEPRFRQGCGTLAITCDDLAELLAQLGAVLLQRVEPEFEAVTRATPGRAVAVAVLFRVDPYIFRSGLKCKVRKIRYRNTEIRMHSCKLPSGAKMPVFGIGTWRMGESARARAAELDALCYALELGYPMIDTAEMYGEGSAEKIVGEAIRRVRRQPYLVSKVYPHNATRAGTVAACDGSLQRLGVQRIDLYLLHWRGSTPLAETFEAFFRLREAGKIADFGVSNFDTDDMGEAAREGRGLVGADQVLYSLSRRGPEVDLLPWLRERSIPLMAYSPLDQGRLLCNRRLSRIASDVGCSPAQLALAWLLAQPGVVTIPKSASRERVEENWRALELVLTADVLNELDQAFPRPTSRQSLDML